MSWEGFKYEPVGGLFERVQRRIVRAQRKIMLRSFIERCLLDLSVRMIALRDNAKLDGLRKLSQFRRILDDYAKLVTSGASAPAGSEATHNVASGAVGLSGA